MQTPDAAASVFGEAVGLAERYAELLATRGVEWGLLGPREVDRIWHRHVLNSVAVAEPIPHGATVLDVGSGAGLPGIPLALARPDLEITLLEPLLRRATFLSEVVDELGLGERVHVERGRAEPAGQSSGLAHRGEYDVVTARAVAALAKLIDGCAPLVRAGGRLVALKGESAADEVAAASRQLKRHRMSAEVRTVVTHPGGDATWLVVCSR